jgi:hypothetical protein
MGKINWKVLMLAPALAVLLASCAGSQVTSKAVAATQFKVTAAQVRWDRFDSITMRYPGSAQINPSREKVVPLLDAFLKGAPRQVEAELAKNGVPKGAAFTVELTPGVLSVAASGGRSFEVSVIVRDSTGASRGYISIVSYGPASMEPDAYVESFSRMLVEELKKAGWL